MAHAAKYTMAAVGHMTAHYERRKNDHGEYIRFSNQSIDTGRTERNYNLAAELQPLPQLDFIRRRITSPDVRMQKRDDVNVMLSWVVTAPKDLPDEELEPFFRHTYDFLRDRYGSENVISAYVHMDEVTPHMHFAFVPIVPYSKTPSKRLTAPNKPNSDFSPETSSKRLKTAQNGSQEPARPLWKVCAHDKLNRLDLKTFHPDLQAYLEHQLEHPVGILNEATIEGNKSIEELRRKSATERLQEIETRNRRSKQLAAELEDRRTDIEEQTATTKELLRSAQAVIAAADVLRNNSPADTGSKAPKKTLNGRNYVISTKKWDSLLQELEEFRTENRYLRTALQGFRQIDPDRMLQAAAEANELRHEKTQLHLQVGAAQTRMQKLRAALAEKEMAAGVYRRYLSERPELLASADREVGLQAFRRRRAHQEQEREEREE